MSICATAIGGHRLTHALSWETELESPRGDQESERVDLGTPREPSGTVSERVTRRLAAHTWVVVLRGPCSMTASSVKKSRRHKLRCMLAVCPFDSVRHLKGEVSIPPVSVLTGTLQDGGV